MVLLSSMTSTLIALAAATATGASPHAKAHRRTLRCSGIDAVLLIAPSCRSPPGPGVFPPPIKRLYSKRLAGVSRVNYCILRRNNVLGPDAHPDQPAGK